MIRLVCGSVWSLWLTLMFAVQYTTAQQPGNGDTSRFPGGRPGIGNDQGGFGRGGNFGPGNTGFGPGGNGLSGNGFGPGQQQPQQLPPMMGWQPTQFPVQISPVPTNVATSTIDSLAPTSIPPAVQAMEPPMQPPPLPLQDSGTPQSSITTPAVVTVGPGLAFTPNVTTVAQGQTVTWQWAASRTKIGNIATASHQITAESPNAACTPNSSDFSHMFQSPVLTTGQYSMRFDELGVFGYYSATGNDCASGMRGIIVVVTADQLQQQEQEQQQPPDGDDVNGIDKDSQNPSIDKNQSQKEDDDLFKVPPHLLPALVNNGTHQVPSRSISISVTTPIIAGYIFHLWNWARW